ncbi:hypothetical protein MMC11_008751 [Xylographa trunciseda]|nr:hypothetical protein [Xylographa trunciseda]
MSVTSSTPTYYGSFEARPLVTIRGAVFLFKLLGAITASAAGATHVHQACGLRFLPLPPVMVQSFSAPEGKHADIRAPNHWGYSFATPSRQKVQSRSPVVRACFALSNFIPNKEVCLQRYNSQFFAQALHDLCGSHIKDFAIIYTDNGGKPAFEVSRSLEHRSGDIFSDDFCDSFEEIVNEEYASQHAGSFSSSESPPSWLDTRRQSSMEQDCLTKGLRWQRINEVNGKSLPQETVAAIVMYSYRNTASQEETRTTVQRIMPFDPSPSCTTSGDEDDDASETDAFEGAGFRLLEIHLSDEEALKKFYTTRFIQMQQIPCKVINKAWIKVVQPKKQARHPYNGGKKAAAAGDPGNGDLTKPDWWPRDGCRHKEPDHIQKKERLILLLHILRNLRDYEGGDGNSVTVEQLRQSTKECFVNMPRFKKAGDYLNEIYHIRSQEERYIRGELDDLVTVAVSMPDKEPKEAARKARIKAVSVAKVKRHRSAVQEPPIAMKGPLASQLPSSIALTSPIERPSVPEPKQESPFNFNRLHLYAESTPTYTQDDSHYSSHTQGRLASSTAQRSFPSTEIESVSQTVFGNRAPLGPPYIAPYNNEGVQNMDYAPISLPENSYTLSAPVVVKQFTDQHGTFNQTAMQDVTYISPTFAQSVRDPAGWYPTPAATVQQQAGAHPTVLYTPSMTPSHHLATTVCNELTQSTTDMPYMSTARYVPTQTEYNTYSGGIHGATHHGLPGYGTANMNTGSYY